MNQAAAFAAAAAGRRERRGRTERWVGRLCPPPLFGSLTKGSLPSLRLGLAAPSIHTAPIHPGSRFFARLSSPSSLKFAVDDESPARPLASLFILPSHVIRSRMENNRDQASRRRHLPIYTFGIVKIVIDNSEAPNRQMLFPRTLSLRASLHLWSRDCVGGGQS